MAEIKVDTKPTFEEFFASIRGIQAIRLVKLADYGLVEPESAHGATWMQPKVKIVATAFDKSKYTIIRWEEKRKAKETVTIWAHKEHGTHRERDLIAKRELLKAQLELEGYQVSEGEWTPENVNAILDAGKQ